MTLKELLNNIKSELTKHSRRIIYLELKQEMFFKMIKLVQFCIRDKKDEPYRNIEIDPKWRRFEVTINDKVFKVKRLK